MAIRVTRLRAPLKIDGNWDKAPWSEIQPESLTHHMGDKPEHFPKTQVKIAYDDSAVYVIFRVEDRYVRSVATNHHGHVYQDSCVEFFFVPGPEQSKGYFNLEMNCGGTILFGFQQARQVGTVMIPVARINEIEVAHSMPRIVDPEIKEPVTWTVEYRLPISIMQEYFNVTRPARGATWQANFYKCADKTSRPHWLTWSPVDLPSPDFHRPEFFGTLKFE